jgi:transcriptional regulator with XRE-family HTH domain
MPAQPPQPTIDVAAAIRREMTAQRVSQEDLADRAGMSQDQISRRLRGAAHITTDDLQRIATALRKPPAYFLTDK